MERGNGLLPSLKDLAIIFAGIVIVGFIIDAFSIAQLKLTGMAAFLNDGYSMCAYNDPIYEYLPITDSKCAWTPINMLILNTHINKSNFKIGDNVCYWKGPEFYGYLVCHRIFAVKMQGNEKIYYIKGLNPKALKEWVPASKIYAEVIDKLPRAIGGPVLFAAYLFKNPLYYYIYINSGGYT